MYRFLVLLCLSLFVSGITQAQPMESFDLKDYQWKNRVLLVFSPEDSEFTLTSQYKVYDKHQAGFDDRDLLIFHISDLDIPDEFGTPVPTDRHPELKKRFGIPEGEFTIILIGKDGTEKLRSNDVLTNDKLFGVIDAMPMRQREMKDDTRN